MSEHSWRERGDDGTWRGDQHPEPPYQGASDPAWESKEEKPNDDNSGKKPNDDNGEGAE